MENKNLLNEFNKIGVRNSDIKHLNDVGNSKYGVYMKKMKNNVTSFMIKNNVTSFMIKNNVTFTMKIYYDQEIIDLITSSDLHTIEKLKLMEKLEFNLE